MFAVRFAVVLQIWQHSTTTTQPVAIEFRFFLAFCCRQLSRRAEVTLEDVERAWLGLGLERQRLTDLLELLQVAGAGHESDAAVDWFKLLALAAGQLGEVPTRVVGCFFFKSLIARHLADDVAQIDRCQVPKFLRTFPGREHKGKNNFIQ